MTALIFVFSADAPHVECVAGLLRAVGHEVVHAARGGEAPADARTPDVAILDTRLDGVDAPALATRLAAAGNGRPGILVLADRADAEWGIAALRAGADDLAFRPVDPLALPLRVEALLARRAAVRERERLTTLEYRVHELESFIYIVTHDMKTPVVNLQGLTGLLEQDHGGTLPPEGREYLGRMRRNAERLEDLLRDLLEYPRRLRLLGPLEMTATGPIAEAAVDGLVELARARRVTVTVAPGLPEVRCDRKRLQQVFHNLVENAIKHAKSENGGKVEVGWAPSSQGPRFHVKDDGPGIPADQLQDIFKLFHRAPGTAEAGTGIGLAVARQLVEAHGGEIWCESSPGAGATFYFRLAP